MKSIIYLIQTVCKSSPATIGLLTLMLKAGGSRINLFSIFGEKVLALLQNGLLKSEETEHIALSFDTEWSINTYTEIINAKLSFWNFFVVCEKLDGVAPMITSPPPTSSTTLSSTMQNQDKI